MANSWGTHTLRHRYDIVWPYRFGKECVRHPSKCSAVWGATDASDKREDELHISLDSTAGHVNPVEQPSPIQMDSPVQSIGDRMRRWTGYWSHIVQCWDIVLPEAWCFDKHRIVPCTKTLSHRSGHPLQRYKKCVRIVVVLCRRIIHSPRSCNANGGDGSSIEEIKSTKGTVKTTDLKSSGLMFIASPVSID